MTAQKKILDLTGSQYLVQKVKSAINDVDSSLSTHIADTDIHVTTADKATWNTVTSKANDSDVVHKSGDESVIGSKRFGVVQSFTGFPTIKLYSTDDDATVVPPYAYQQDIRFTDKNNVVIAYFIFQHRTDSNEPFRTCWRQQKMDGTQGYYSINFNNKGVFYPENNNAIDLGGSGNRWKSVYATEYYYGSNNIEFSTKFVTTDTDQTISGNKTFNGNTNCVGELSQTAPFKMTADTSFVIGNKNTSIYDQNGFQCANEQISYNNSKNIRRVWAVNNNGSGTIVSAGFNLILSASGTKIFYPITDSDTDNGTPSSYWKNTYTKFVNGVEPSSLGMPSDINSRIDISSYFTNTGTGQSNSYTVPANGYIYLTLSELTNIHCFSRTSGNVTNYAQTFTKLSNSTGALYVLFPVRKNDVFVATWYTTTTVSVDSAFFIPCQGNV